MNDTKKEIRDHISVLKKQMTLMHTEMSIIQQKISELDFSQTTTHSTEKHIEEVVLVLFDFETTGLGKTSDICITEVGAIHVDPFKGHILHEFRELVQPTVHVTAGASRVNGLTDRKLSSFPMWDNVGSKFNSWLESLRENKDTLIYLCAHNGKRYDSRLLIFEHSRHQLKLPRNLYHIDTLPLFKSMFIGLDSYSLSALYKYMFDDKIKDAHTALGDVKAMLRLLEVGLMVGEHVLEKWIKAHSESFDSVQKRCYGVKMLQEMT